MVLRHVLRLLGLADDASRVTRVAAVDVRLSYQYHVCRATSLVSVILAGNVVRILTADFL